LWFLTVAIICVRIYAHPSWHSVFPTYRNAGAAWIHQTQLYGAPGIFLYRPLVAAFFSPFAQLALRVVSTVTYLGFVSAHILNSWFPIKKNVYLVHAIQPCLTLCFCAALFLWWKRQLLDEGEQSCGASGTSKMQY
jgi:hypothetical protein